MKKYTHLFFDLDRTLWDFDKNSRDTMNILFDKYNLLERGIPSADLFFSVYTEYNDKLWDQYRKGLVEKEVLKVKRYELVLSHFGILNSEMASIFGQEYLEILPTLTAVFPGTHKMLDALVGKYHLHIITNGFEEVQDIKMAKAGLTQYFEKVITSEAAGVRKPDQKIFQYALEQCGATKENSIMIGDDLPVDIIGAADYGMDQIFFNPFGKKHDFTPTIEISELLQICDVLS